MKLKLPDGEKVELSRDNDIEKRMKYVKETLDKFEDFIVENYDTKQVKYFLEGCANYLVWCKDEDSDVSHNKKIIQREKTIRLNSGYDKNEIPFSSLSQLELYKYGLEETEEIL